MTFWNGDRWVVEPTPHPAKPWPRLFGPRSGLLAAMVVAVLIAPQLQAPGSAGSNSGTLPGSAQLGSQGQTTQQLVVSRSGNGSGSQPAPSDATRNPAAGPKPKATPPGHANPTPGATLGPTPTAGSTATPTPNPTPPPTPAPTSVPPTGGTLAIVPATGTLVYMHYYLWWTQRHWQDKLGTSYPYSTDPLPVPGTTDASGCNSQVFYPGATIVDIPNDGLANQAQAATFDTDIKIAVDHGITGFVADWAGTGSTTQGPSSSGYNARLDLLVQRVEAWNAGHTTKFRLALDFAAFGNYNRAASAMTNDLAYFVDRYGSSSAFGNAFSTRPLAMIIGSRKYPLATIEAVSIAMRPSLFLLGDETSTSLARNAALLDGSSYYWSSESPTNSGAKSQIGALGSALHAAKKPWFAPFTSGYNAELIGGHCVPRNGFDTLDTIWSWNSASLPDAWFGISWNEYVENSYFEPSLRYGDSYLNELARLAGL